MGTCRVVSILLQARMADLQTDVNGDELAAAVVREALAVVANAQELHAELFAAFPEAEVKTVSRLEREAKELPNRSLVYGEIPFATIEEIFQLMRSQFGVLLDRGGKFYDLGSGCGKVILEGLHGIALEVLDHWRYKMLDSLPAAKADVDVGFVRADAATNVAIWKDATLVFCNSTCFSDSSNLVEYFVVIHNDAGVDSRSTERWDVLCDDHKAACVEALEDDARAEAAYELGKSDGHRPEESILTSRIGIAMRTKRDTTKQIIYSTRGKRKAQHI
ncbi:hypothetical protein FI667_g16739, partial [Globisporangium splendens]